MKTFTLTEYHVALLKRMCFDWQPSPYDGAPVVNIKRPYGNSNVWQDIAEIVGIRPMMDDAGELHWPEGTRERCLALHRQMATALQVCLSAHSFAPGDYVSDHWWSDIWRLREHRV